MIQSCWSNGLNHVGGVCQMNTGSTLAGRPSLGSWVTYGLGSENANLPGFVVMKDAPRATVAGGPRNWGPGFMPASYQGTQIDGGAQPIANLRTPAAVGPARQQGKLDYLGQLNRRHLSLAAGSVSSSTRGSKATNWRFACRLRRLRPLTWRGRQSPRSFSTAWTNPATDRIGRLCLLARRLVERGVRFVQIYCGAGSKWDAHSAIEANHSQTCGAMDRPVAGLLKDLKSRGLLDETLVVWGGEFGRTPMSEKGDGRDHNPYGFTMWMAGGGVKEGMVVGKTDEVGLHAIEDRLHVHDIHATILHALGVDHSRLVFRHQGRPERPTVNEGRVFHGLFKA